MNKKNKKLSEYFAESKGLRGLDRLLDQALHHLPGLVLFCRRDVHELDLELEALEQRTWTGLLF